MVNLKSLMLLRPHGSLRSKMASQETSASCGASGLDSFVQPQKKSQYVLHTSLQLWMDVTG